MSTGRLRWIGWGAAILAVLAGSVACTGAQANPKRPAASSAAARPPAQAAGGACQLLDFNAVANALGVRFDVAAAAQQGETFSCVLVQDAASYPDLTLAVTPTAVDANVYRTSVQPAGSAAVPDLGKVGYSTALGTLAGDGGPGVEVGWLAGNGRLITLQYRFPAKAADTEIATLTPKLVTLAKLVDQSSL